MSTARKPILSSTTKAATVEALKTWKRNVENEAFSPFSANSTDWSDHYSLFTMTEAIAMAISFIGVPISIGIAISGIITGSVMLAVVPLVAAAALIALPCGGFYLWKRYQEFNKNKQAFLDYINKSIIAAEEGELQKNLIVSRGQQNFEVANQKIYLDKNIKLETNNLNVLHKHMSIAQQNIDDMKNEKRLMKQQGLENTPEFFQLTTNLNNKKNRYNTLEQKQKSLKQYINDMQTTKPIIKKQIKKAKSEYSEVINKDSNYLLLVTLENIKKLINKKVSKEAIIRFIENFDKKIQISLFEQCLKPDTDLGKYFYKPRWFFECTENNGTRLVIKEKLYQLEKRKPSYKDDYPPFKMDYDNNFFDAIAKQPLLRPLNR